MGIASPQSAGTRINGRVLAGIKGQDVFLSLEGRGTHLISQAMRDFLSNSVTRGFRLIHFNLAGCTYMDSTFLGVLTSTCLKLKRCGGKFELVGASPRSEDLFRTLGVDRFFDFVSDEPEVSTSVLKPLEDDGLSKDRWGETVLEAHRALVEGDEGNAARFKDVLDCLENGEAEACATPEPSPARSGSGE